MVLGAGWLRGSVLPAPRLHEVQDSFIALAAGLPEVRIASEGLEAISASPFLVAAVAGSWRES